MRWASTCRVTAALILVVTCTGASPSPRATVAIHPSSADVDRVTMPRTGIALRADWYRAPTPDAAAVLLVHGWHPVDAQPLQTMAAYARRFQAAGFHVLVPALRGWRPSGGRDDCGGKQVDDVLRWVDWLRSRRGVDAGPIFVAGYSQGGQVGLLAAARSRAIRAVVAYAPVTELPSWGQESDILAIDTYLNDECGGPSGWSSRDVLAAADRINAPVLLVHGTRDTRVPVSQSLTLHQRLTTLRRPATIRLVRGRGHAIDEILRPDFAIRFFADATTAPQ